MGTKIASQDSGKARAQERYDQAVARSGGSVKAAARLTADQGGEARWASNYAEFTLMPGSTSILGRVAQNLWDSMRVRLVVASPATLLRLGGAGVYLHDKKAIVIPPELVREEMSSLLLHERRHALNAAVRAQGHVRACHGTLTSLSSYAALPYASQFNVYQKRVHLDEPFQFIQANIGFMVHPHQTDSGETVRPGREQWGDMDRMAYWAEVLLNQQAKIYGELLDGLGSPRELVQLSSWDRDGTKHASVENRSVRVEFPLWSKDGGQKFSAQADVGQAVRVALEDRRAIAGQLLEGVRTLRAQLAGSTPDAEILAHAQSLVRLAARLDRDYGSVPESVNESAR